MKIIDDKGRLFGKINIIDFLVILLLLSLIPMFYFGYKIFTKKQVVDEMTGPKFEFDMICKFIKLEPEIAKLISVSDKEYNSKGEISGEIIALKEISPYLEELNIGRGKKIITEHPHLKEVTAWFKLNAVVKDNEIYYKNHQFAINSPFKFKTDKYEVIAIPLSKYDAKVFEGTYLDFYIILKALDDKTLSLISRGDKEIDTNGNTVAEILYVGKIENDSFTFNVGENNFIRVEDPSKRQIMVRMRLNCQIRNEDEIYFKNIKIQYNTLIEFKTDEYKVDGIVTPTYEIPHVGKWISLQVKFTGIIPEMSNIIKKGDSERDPIGEVSAKIISIISNNPSEVLTLTKKNDLITLKHPFYRDIVVQLDIYGIEKEGIYYFKNYPVKIGNTITFTSDLYSVSGTITLLNIK